MEDWNKKLTTAAEKGDIEALKLSLQNGAEIDYQDGGGWTALMFAASEGHLEICRLLIDTGCKIDTTSGGGRTALMLAASEGQLEICRLLIDTGCKIDITAVGGETALMFAAQRGHLEICRLLIDTGCKIDTTSYGGGRTALMLAARGGHLEICRLLIDTGCKIDTTEYNGYTALHLAAQYGHLQTTRCLVEQGGASPLVTTHKDETPYDLAAESQYKEVMEYLQVAWVMLTYNRTFIRREDVFLLMLQESLILPSNQCIPGMWSTEQSVIITEHSNYYEQMTLVVKQIMESGPDAPKPSLPKRPKSKLDSLFTHAKKKKTFDPKELHDYLRFRCVDQCGINKQFIVEDMWKSGTLQKEELLDILKRATRQIQRCEAQMLLFYIKFGTFLEQVKAWHENEYNKNTIQESWPVWLKTNACYSDRHARRLRNLSRVLKDYPLFGLVGLPVSYFTTGKLKDITEMLSIPTYAEYWKQPLPTTTNEMPQSQ